MSNLEETVKYGLIDLVAPKPWKLLKNTFQHNLVTANEMYLPYSEDVLNEIVKCVNEHDNILLEVAKLKQESKDWENKYYDCRKMLGTENDKLKHNIKILQILKNIKEQESGVDEY